MVAKGRVSQSPLALGDMSNTELTMALDQVRPKLASHPAGPDEFPEVSGMGWTTTSGACDWVQSTLNALFLNNSVHPVAFQRVLADAL